MNLNNEIKKSLIDRTVPAASYNPSIVTNTFTKHIKNRIKHLLSSSKRVDIAVSYVVWSGLSLIYDELKKFDSTSRLVLTIDGNVTDILSLNKLNELSMQVKVYSSYGNHQGFHLKSYLFEQEDKSTLFIGSANISSRAFGMVHEMGTEINSDKNGYIIDKYNEEFTNLWENDFSRTLSTDLILEYSDFYIQRKNLGNKLEELFITSTTIKPNYMQVQALEKLAECRKHFDRGLVIAATGTGKTYLSAFDIKNSQAKKVLFLVHNRLILTSAINAYTKVFPNKKIIELESYNINEINQSDFIFTTDKTAFNHLFQKVRPEMFDYIVYDEAHKIGLETKYMDLIQFFSPKFSLGITATPERTDNPKYLFDIFKYHIPYEIRLLSAMSHELVCPLTYYGLSLDSRLLESNERFNYSELALYLREQISSKGHYGEKLKCLIFCSDIKEAQELSASLNLINFNSVAVVSGKKMSRLEIDEHIKSLQSDALSSLEIICIVNKFNEGVDIPEVNTIIMLRNTSSSIIYLQQLGRGLRKTNDPHKYVTVFDIIGNSTKNYSIAQVLTGNETVDKRELYKYANDHFETVNPFINVHLEEKVSKAIIQSISSNFKVETEIKKKLESDLYRFKEIPTLKELYLHTDFKELELLQLLSKNFYEPFKKHYIDKYQIDDSSFIKNFMSVISQFVFRCYDHITLSDYVKVLSGEKIKNNTLRRVLLPHQFEDGLKTAINSDYHKAGKNYPAIFEMDGDYLSLTSAIIKSLKEANAYELFLEHIELFQHLSTNQRKRIEIFDLIDKGEFLFHFGSNDTYMNGVGERIDRKNKAVYCTIKISSKETFHANYISGNDTFIYHTQGSKTEEAAINKVNELIDNKYTFYICAQFPHLGYTTTSYFNLGKLTINNVSDVKFSKTRNNKFNHEIEFKLMKNFPKEFFQIL